MLETLPVLSLAETRVLGTLIEKQRTVPDTYPLSVNALSAGCNQKTSRNPVLDLSEADIVQALDTLRELGLAYEMSGGRVARFAHKIEHTIGIPTQASALLCVLLLRGPQTAGELRLNGERLHKFADISSVEAFLAELAERSPALVVELPRLPGSRENRWAHLLSGEPAIEAVPSRAIAAPANQELDELRNRVSALETEMEELRNLLLEHLTAN